MPAVHRVTDMTAPHGGPCAGASVQSMALTGSSNVLVNGLPAVYLGCTTAIHKCIKSDGSSENTQGTYLGVRNVLVNGMPIQCVGDICSCGSIAIVGSSNVFTST